MFSLSCRNLTVPAAILGPLLLPATGQCQAAANTDSHGLPVAGWIENSWIGEPPTKVKAKLDTGAKSSSINAPHYREFKQAGQRYVSFELTNGSERVIAVTRPVVRTVTIRRAGVGKRKRPVIKLIVCVAGVTAEAEFTLADRSEMTYQVLIGRNFLANKVLVDSGRTFLNSRLCIKP